MEQVKLSDYDPQWAAEYEEEKDFILKALQDIVMGIEHIGSTSVPGLAAKPVIDMMVGVQTLSVLTDFHKAMLLKIGYEYVEHEHFPERRFFRKGAWRNGTHHLHVYAIKSSHWTSNLLFRNYLRDHPEARDAYGSLKRSLLQPFQHDRAGYTKAKEPFIQTVLKKANSWYES